VDTAARRAIGGRRRILWSVVAAVVILVAGGSYLYISNDMVRAYLGHDPYQYKHFCYLDGDQCITVVAYRPFKLVDTTYKKYVLLGRAEHRLPFRARYIEYPNDTNLFVDWKSKSKVEIISNLPPVKVMQLSDVVEVVAIYSNVLYETSAAKNPAMSW